MPQLCIAVADLSVNCEGITASYQACLRTALPTCCNVVNYTMAVPVTDIHQLLA
jgi:hypothetical protein